MSTIDNVISMNIDDFFHYVKNIRYGYKDHFGKLHFTSDEDFSVHDYSFSSPEEIVINNCCWCWDLAEMIKLYCTKHDIVYKSYFMEYFSDDLHQTHTQVFLYYQGKWSAAPDNCLGLEFGEPNFDEFGTCLDWFTSLFTGYLKTVLKEKYDASNLFIKEYTRTFSPGISEAEYLSQVRQNEESSNNV